MDPSCTLPQPQRGGGEWPSQAPKAVPAGARVARGLSADPKVTFIFYMRLRVVARGGRSGEASGAGGLTVDCCEPCMIYEARLNNQQKSYISLYSSAWFVPNHMPDACRCVGSKPHPTLTLYTRVSQHPSANGPCLSTAWGACTAATCTVDMTVAAGDDTAPLSREGAPTFASQYLISALVPMRPLMRPTTPPLVSAVLGAPNAPRHHPAPRERRPGRLS